VNAPDHRILPGPAIDWLAALMRARFNPALRLNRERGGLLTVAVDGAKGTIVFDRPEPSFLGSGSQMSCVWWNAGSQGWRSVLQLPLPAPGAEPLPQPLIERQGDDWLVHYDIPGLTYWMLSRREEVGSTDLDQYGRFSASASHAHKHGYLDRPLVDEWMEILGQVVARVWPQMQLAQRRFDLKPSHDVDIPSRYAFRSGRAFVRAVGADLLRHHRIADSLRAPWIRLASGDRLHRSDPANTFDWIMNVSERHSLTSAFYFICGRTDEAMDAGYEPEDAAIRVLMRGIHGRGHEIGLHPSFDTYRNPQALADEASRLRRVCDEEGIHQKAWGGRMHYLRWENPTTPNAWENAGMAYDSTLGYADHAGFRCGTCIEYPAYDPVNDRMLDLQIRPLVAMECTVMDEPYMGLGHGEAAFAAFSGLKQACRAVGGTFSLLWHNSELDRPVLRDLYESVLKS
jgi:hypothetical protein